MRFLPVAFRTILLFKMTDIAYNHTNARRFVLSLLFRCPFMNAVNSVVGARVHVLAALLSFFLSLCLRYLPADSSQLNFSDGLARSQVHIYITYVLHVHGMFLPLQKFPEKNISRSPLWRCFCRFVALDVAI